MKFTNVLATTLLSLLSTACIQNEEPNTEADILKCILPKEIFEYDNTNYYEPYDESINAYPLYISVNSKATLTQLAPEFVLTEGATIEPASGSIQDFTHPVRYTVTSADGKWHRTYSVSISDDLQIIPEQFHFDKLSSKSSKYHIFYEENKAKGEFMEWASANQGYMLVSGNSPATEYPTSQADGGIENSKCAKLVTKSTGGLGSLVGAPLAAGNLFLGSFDLSKALTQTLQSTHFGLPTTKKPLRFTGYYKYKPGEQMQDAKGNKIEGTDEGAIYAVVYKNHDAEGNSIYLTGEDIMTNPLRVAMAKLYDVRRCDDWTSFDVAFDYWEDIDVNLLHNMGYSLAILCSSSKNGDLYEGALGSTLWVDNLRIITEEE